TRVQVAVMPPMILGVFFVLYRGLPGSTRSGENARKNDSPTVSPRAESIGRISSSVVPGYVVLSRTTSCPGRSRAAIALAAEATIERTGALVLLRGVGTQMMTASQSASSAKSELARSRP